MKTEEQQFREIYQKLDKEGRLCSPRELLIKEIENFHYNFEPYTRFANFECRKLNLNYIKKEFLWYLKGNRYDTSIVEYAKLWGDIVNEDGSINSNYGQYIFTSGQFDKVIETLKNDKDSRRASIMLLNKDHLLSKTRDIPCLAGKTLIKSPEGDITIEELSKKFENNSIKKYPIFSFNEKTRNIEIKWCTNAWKTGNKKVLKITFNDTSFIKITPEHKVYRKIKKHIKGHIQSSTTIIDIIEAEKLKVGDRLWATCFLNSAKDDRPMYIKNLSSNWNYKNQISIHRSYDEFLHGKLPKKYVVHHINENKKNNKKKNLQRMTESKHNSLNMFENDNPSRRENKIQKQKRIKNLKQTLKKLGKYNYGWGLYHKKRQLNHKIIKIEERSSESVYDFICEDNHNAIIGTGIIVHNCTYSMNFRIRENKLNMTVHMRSQDAIYGFGSDIPIFSFIHEMVYISLKETYPELNIGNYYHTVDSFHIY